MRAFKINGNFLKEIEVEHVSTEMLEAFKTPLFPVVYEGKICGVKFEPEIDGLLIHREFTNEEVLQMAVRECENMYHDAITEAGLKITNYLCKIYNELQKLDPPWHE